MTTRLLEAARAWADAHASYDAVSEETLNDGGGNAARLAAAGAACDAADAALRANLLALPAAEATERDERLAPNSRLADAVASLTRNGVCGTCVDCPDGDGRTYPERREPVYPERCPNFARYDHKISAGDLAKSIANEWQRYECDPLLDFIDARALPVVLRVGDGIEIRGGGLRRAIQSAADHLGYQHQPALTAPRPPPRDEVSERERALVRAGWNDPHAMETVGAMIAEVDRTHPRPPSFAEFFDAKMAWSRETFGPLDRYSGICAHIRKELSEIEANPSDLEEWIDVALLAMDGAWRSAGADGAAFDAAMRAKDAKNRGRTWPDWRTLAAGEVSEHVRPAAPPPSESPSQVTVQEWAQRFAQRVLDEAAKHYPSRLSVIGSEPVAVILARVGPPPSSPPSPSAMAIAEAVRDACAESVFAAVPCANRQVACDAARAVSLAECIARAGAR